MIHGIAIGRIICLIQSAEMMNVIIGSVIPGGCQCFTVTAAQRDSGINIIYVTAYNPILCSALNFSSGRSKVMQGASGNCIGCPAGDSDSSFT